MRLDLTPLVTGRVTKLDVDTSFVPDAADETLVELPGDITLEGPIRLIGTIRSMHGYMSLETTVSVDYLTRCDRCLSDVHETLEFPFHRLVPMGGRTGQGFTEDDGTDPDELLEMTDNFLDVVPAVVEEVALWLPQYHLCSVDCPGLCPRCGKPLADGDCGCKEEKEIDPRLAILQKLLDNSEKQ